MIIKPNKEKLKVYDGVDKVVSFSELKEKMKNMPAIPTFNTGITKLDELCEGFETGELWIVSGWTKMGKTLLCQTMTKNFALQGIYSLWFTFEITARKFLEQFDDSVVGYLPSQLKDKDLNWIEARIVEAKEKYGTKVIFIDHLHYLFDIFISRNPSLDIGGITRRLKGICLEHEVIIFLVAHTSKTSSQTEPTDGDIRDSSFIVQDSDGTLLVWRVGTKINGEVVFEEDSIVSVALARRSGVRGKKVRVKYVDDVLVEMEDPFLNPLPPVNEYKDLNF